jgi:hypothetical protein
VIGCALLAIKRRIVSREAEHGDALPQRGLPEYEVPGWLRIQILHRDRQNAERIARQFCHQKTQHVGRENLVIVRQRIYTRREILPLDGRKCIGFQTKINRRVLAQPLRRRAAARRKFSERLQVNFPPRPVRLIWPRVLNLAKHLAWLGMHGQPIVRPRLRNRLEISDRLEGMPQVYG